MKNTYFFSFLSSRECKRIAGSYGVFLQVSFCQIKDSLDSLLPPVAPSYKLENHRAQTRRRGYHWQHSQKFWALPRCMDTSWSGLCLLSFLNFDLLWLWQVTRVYSSGGQQYILLTLARQEKAKDVHTSTTKTSSHLKSKRGQNTSHDATINGRIW